MPEWIITWWPVLAFIGGLIALCMQLWVLNLIFQVKAMIRERHIKDSARFEALELKVNSKVDHEQARTVVHQYHVDLKRMREEIMEEMGLSSRNGEKHGS